MRVNIERTLAVGLSQELLNGFDIFSIRLQQGDEGVTGRMPADLLVNPICLRNRARNSAGPLEHNGKVVADRLSRDLTDPARPLSYWDSWGG